MVIMIMMIRFILVLPEPLGPSLAIPEYNPHHHPHPHHHDDDGNDHGSVYFDVIWQIQLCCEIPEEQVGKRDLGWSNIIIVDQIS